MRRDDAGHENWAHMELQQCASADNLKDGLQLLLCMVSNVHSMAHGQVQVLTRSSKHQVQSDPSRPS